MKQEQFEAAYMTHLTKQQAAAVRSINGPVLLLAVPGSGKTTVLVTRLGYMVQVAGISPERILTVTYTVAAARDMKARYIQLFGEAAGDLEFRTINGICAKVILYYGRQIGKRAFQLIENEKERLAMLGEIYRSITGSFATESDLGQISTQITYIKNQMLNEDALASYDQESEYPIADILKHYGKLLRDRSLMDYDDQMIYALKILQKSPSVLNYFRECYPYLCVDEAQDTSYIQHAILALLAGKSGNLFMVGDEDQSIYGFRAAYPEALLHFENAHPGAQVLLMEENFRSDPSIVSAADRFIKKNILRHDKSMLASRQNDRSRNNGNQSKVRVIEIKGSGAQYSYLKKVAEGLSEEQQTAVLFRDNESAIPLIDILEREKIPYRYRSRDLSFFTNRVVIDISNLLSFALNPEDAELFLQIYYKIGTYMTKQQALMAADTRITRHYEAGFMDIAARMPNLPNGTRRSIKSAAEHFAQIKQETPYEAIWRIIGPMGYGEYLKRSGLSEKKVRVLKYIAAKESTIEGFLNRLKELRLIIAEKEPSKAPLILSTIHSSKGLEYDTVYLIDVEDGVFPESIPDHPGENEEWSAYEEERRIFYVGVTRAKNMLNLFRVKNNSTFIADLVGEGQNKPRQKSGSSPKAFGVFCEGLKKGTEVTHAKFGDGIVVANDGEKVSIRFGNEVRTMSLSILFEKQLLRLY